MNGLKSTQKELPIRGNIGWIYAISGLIVLLMGSVSLAGLLYQSKLYPTEALVQGFVPNDVVSLFVGVPIFLVCMWGTWRGKLAALLCLPGALIFAFYNYLAYVVAAPLSWALLGYLGIVVASLYGLIGLAVNLDGEALREKLTGKVPERLAGGVMAGFGGLFLLRVFLEIGGSLVSGEPIPGPELGANISDFFMSPLLVITGVCLWRRKSFGYLAGLGMLFQASMLFIALIIFLVVQPMVTSAPFAAMDVVFVLVMGLVCFVPFGLFWRGVRNQG